MLRLETKSRARALQILYAWELQGGPPLARVATGLARRPIDSGGLRGTVNRPDYCRSDTGRSHSRQKFPPVDHVDRGASHPPPPWFFDEIQTASRPGTGQT